jgi:hypothetical protein
MPQSVDFNTDMAHTFRCIQDMVGENKLVYKWEVIDVYKSAPMYGILAWTNGDSFTIARN